MARQRGAAPELVAALQDRGGREPLERLAPGWRAALAYADVVHRSGHDVADELYARLAETWDPGEIVELTLAIGTTEYFTRFTDSWRVAPTR